MLSTPLRKAASFSHVSAEMGASRPAVFVSDHCHPSTGSANQPNIDDAPGSAQTLSCMHCDFKCQLTSDMTQHRWEQHPLLMRRKQHLMSSSIVNRKRQLSETFGDKISAQEMNESEHSLENCGKARRILKTVDTSAKTDRNTSSQTCLKPEIVSLNKQKSSSLGDITSITDRLTVTDHAKNTDRLSLFDGLAATPLVAFYQKHVADCITSLMQQPASREQLPTGNVETESVMSSTGTLQQTGFNWLKGPRVGSAYVADNLAQSYATTSPIVSAAGAPGTYQLPCFVRTATSIRCLEEAAAMARGAVSPLMHSAPVKETISQVVSPRSSPNQPENAGQQSGLKSNGVHAEVGRAVQGPSIVEAHYVDKLSALSDVARLILVSDRGRSSNAMSAASADTLSQQLSPEDRRPPVFAHSSISGTTMPAVSREQRPNIRTAFAPQDPDYKSQAQITELTLALQREKISHSNSPPTPHRRMGPERHLGAYPSMDDRRVKSLEEAVRNTDCCDPSMRSNVLPFRCADGSWKMVRSKRIGGAWLIQMPGKDTASVVIPPADGMNAKLAQASRSDATRSKSFNNPAPGKTCKQLLTAGRYAGLGQSCLNMQRDSPLRSLLLQKS